MIDLTRFPQFQMIFLQAMNHLTLRDHLYFRFPLHLLPPLFLFLQLLQFPHLLQILRLLEDEAVKERTGEVRIQVPVPVGTFLLNEKRQQLESVQRRHNVRVLVVPNPNIETPNYDLLRLREVILQVDRTERLILPNCVEPSTWVIGQPVGHDAYTEQLLHGRLIFPTIESPKRNLPTSVP